MKRTILLLVVVFLIGVPVAMGATGGDEGDEDVTLKLSHFWGPSNTANPPFLELIDQFEARYPNVDITVDTYPADDQFIPRLNADFAADTIPDVFFTWPGLMAKNYYESGKILELSSYLDGDPEWVARYAPGSLETVQYDGQQLSVPLEGFIAPVFYNEAIFADLGLMPPQTFDELLDVIGEIRDADLIPLTATIDNGWTLGLYWTVLANRTVGVPGVREAFANADFSDPRFLAATESLIAFRDANAFPQDFIGLQNNEATNLFVTGEAAMYHHGSWWIGAFSAEGTPEGFADQVGFFNFPSLSGGRGSNNDWLNGIILTISLSGQLENDPAKLEAALNFLKFMSEEENATYLAETSKHILPVRTSPDPELMGALTVELIEAVNDAENTFTLHTLSSPPEMQRILNEQLTSLWLGDQDAEQTWEAIRDGAPGAYE